MPGNPLGRVVLEDDDRDTVYSFSDSCSTASESSQLPTRDASDPSNTATAAGDKAACRSTVTLLPVSLFPTDAQQVADVLGDPTVVRAHVRWHIRTAAAIENSQFSLRQRSLSSSSSLFDIARSSSALGASHRQSSRAAANTTPWLALTCTLASPAEWKRRQRVSLDIGRSLLSACVALPSSSTASKDGPGRGVCPRSADSQAEQFVVPTVSRRHAQLTFVIARHAAPVHMGESRMATRHADEDTQAVSSDGWRCDAVEVIDWVAATSFRGVPLNPLHRYHFSVNDSHITGDDRRGRGAPSLADALGGHANEAHRRADHLPVTVAVGRWCTVEVVLETPAGRERVCSGSSSAATGTKRRQTVYLDVDTSEEPEDTILSLVNDAEPAILIRGKGNRAVQGASHGTGPGSSEGPCIGGRDAATRDIADDARGENGKASRKRPTSTRASTTGDDGNAPARKRRSAVATSNGSGHTVVFTTGIELSTSEERRLKAAHIRVNPPLVEASRAKVLVAQPPLNRSVKLLTVLPFVDALVTRSWLEEVLERAGVETQADTRRYTYTEPKTAKSIETTNGFDLTSLLQVPPVQRQTLFKDFRFFVHRDTAPQEPPSNDLKSVLAASGGTVVKKPEDANVLVVPSAAPTKACWKSLAPAFKRTRTGATPLVVTRDDVFKCVLRQEKMSVSTVTNRPDSCRASGTGMESHSPKPRSSRRVSDRSPSGRLSSPAAKTTSPKPRTSRQRQSIARSSSRKR